MLIAIAIMLFVNLFHIQPYKRRKWVTQCRATISCAEVELVVLNVVLALEDFHRWCVWNWVINFATMLHLDDFP